MKTRAAIGPSFAALLLLSCASPFLESARDPKGLSEGLGVVVVSARIPDLLDPGNYSDHRGAMSVVDVHYGFTRPFSLSAQLGAGYAKGDHFPGSGYNSSDSLGVFCASASASAKLYIGKHGALRLSAGAFGAPPWNVSQSSPTANLVCLQDIGDFLTIDGGVGLPVFVGVGLVGHIHFGQHVVTHVSAGTWPIRSGGLGLGVDYVRSPGN
jgi:hypothetical protein